MNCQIRPVIEYIITRYSEDYGEPLTRVRLNLLLALALFTRSGEVDIHELAPCFGYRIIGNPIQSQILDAILGQLASEERVRIRHGLIRRGTQWRPSNEIPLPSDLIGRISGVLVKYAGLGLGELRGIVSEVFAITPSVMDSGLDLVEYLKDVVVARRVGAGVPVERLYVSDL